MYPFMTKGRLPGRDRMVVGFTTTCAISVLSDPTSLLSGEATNIFLVVIKPHIAGIMVTMLASSAVDRRSEPR
jgi:hypothetical protein